MRAPLIERECILDIFCFLFVNNFYNLSVIMRLRHAGSRKPSPSTAAMSERPAPCYFAAILRKTLSERRGVDPVSRGTWSRGR
jgi:hypothetical protein